LYNAVHWSATKIRGSKVDQDNGVTQTVRASEARQRFSEIVNRVFREQARVVIERSGIPVAAIVSAEDLKRLERYDRERAARFAALDRISAAFADVPLEELEREVARSIAETRAEMRQEREAAVTPR
jgi:prevent-host-death family protein